jgi:hypothetical protein
LEKGISGKCFLKHGSSEKKEFKTLKTRLSMKETSMMEKDLLMALEL